MLSLDQFLLLGSIVIPAFVSFLLFVGVGNTDGFAKKLAYVAFTFPFLAGILLFVRFEEGANGYAFEFLCTGMGLQELKIHFHLGLNGVSSPLFAMAGIVGLAAGLTAINSGAERIRLYLALLSLMQAGLMGVFASVDLFFYYLFHEFALIPTFIMIGLWGGRDRRSVALEITIYLTLGALLSLAGLVAINTFVDAESFDFPSLSIALAESNLFESTKSKIFGFLLIGFGILVALFPFHTWAVRGYDAAPTSVSMLHAGVLKKFGLYGLIQVATPLLPESAQSWSTLLLWLALGNVLFVGMVAIAQTNLKSMVGNGSVMHMGYCFLGIGVCSSLGASSAIMLMVAHGLSVSLMFLLAHYIQRRTDTFEMSDMGGLAKQTPLLACFFVAASLATIGLPGFGNFWGEFGVFLSLGQQPDTQFFLYFAALGIIISAVFGLRAVARIFYGEPSEKLESILSKKKISDLSFSEIFPASLILLALLLIGLWPLTISPRIDSEIENRYNAVDSQVVGSSLPPCCLAKEEKNTETPSLQLKD
ncbi:MAG: NADH-quinone oxidoreductase subunit M [Opitutales bacterium]|nr:NADH-quinone oxidoreductase subunit M [Opitutales bacterium]